MLDDDLLAALRMALEGSPDWLDLRSRLEREVPAGDEERYRPFIYAFGYALVERGQRARRERSGGPFATMMSGPGWSFPPPVSQVADDHIQVWREAA